jgi:WD40 repeat protein
MADHMTTPQSTLSSGFPGTAATPGSEQPVVDFLDHWKTGIREVKTFRGHSHGVWTVAYAPDGQTLASGGVDRYVRMWDIETGRLLRSLRGHTHDIRAIAYTPDGQLLATGSEDRTIRPQCVQPVPVARRIDVGTREP